MTLKSWIIPQIILALPMVFLTAASTTAAEFRAVPPMVLRMITAENGDISWSMPQSWNAPNSALPRTAQDVGIIGDGHSLGTGDPLGSGKDRPIIQINTGGLLWITREFDQPIRLNGGTMQPGWNNGRVVRGPVEVTADSTLLGAEDSTYDGHLRIAGKIFNSKPVTLSTDGDIKWESDAGKTLSATIEVRAGTLFVMNSPDTSHLGTGEIRLLPAGRLVFRGPANRSSWELVNNVSGDGTLQGSDGNPWVHTLIAKGVMIHPGQVGSAGTLSFAGRLQFDHADNGRLNKLVIEVHGPGNLVGHNYSQLVMRGKLINSLDNVDLQLMIDPALPADQVRDYLLNVLTVSEGDISGYKAFHSVTIHQGDKIGTAKVIFHPDAEAGGSVVTVSEMKLP